MHEPDTAFSVRTVNEKFCIFVLHLGDLYVYRYAYDTFVEARFNGDNLEQYFGKPVSIEADLIANYHKLRYRGPVTKDTVEHKFEYVPTHRVPKTYYIVMTTPQEGRKP